MPEQECSVDGCAKGLKANGLCSMHETRLRVHGSVYAVHHHVEKHGMINHPLYTTWAMMRHRCYDPNATRYERYGGRGIAVCDRWRYSFAAFVADVGERPEGHTLDRIDANGNYEPGNVRWSSLSTQQKNQPTRCDNKSGHKGVSLDSRSGKWRAYLNDHGKRVELGRFADIGDAIDARHRATVTDPDVTCCPVLDQLRSIA